MPFYAPMFHQLRLDDILDSPGDSDSRETPKKLFCRRRRQSRQPFSRLQSVRHESTDAAAADAHRSHQQDSGLPLFYIFRKLS